MKHNLKIILNDFINLCLTGIIYIVPKENNLWVFGSWFGESYADNSKYLFEYVYQHQPQIKAIWITEKKEVFDLIASKGYTVYMYNSPKGIYSIFRAKIGIVTTTCRDINSCFNKSMNIVWLWHGTPLKRIKYDRRRLNETMVKKKSLLHSLYNSIFRKNEDFTKAMFIATSQEVQAKISSAFRVKETQVKITGYPRNDAFFQDVDREVPLVKKIMHFKKKDKKILIYMPTFRIWDSFSVGKFLASNLDYLNENLEKLNSILLVKLHHGDMRHIEKLDLKQYANIIPINDASIHYDIYPILKLTDLLITDYSSIYFDYLLLDKPIIFAPFDFDDYQESYRTFYYDYDEVTPGEKAKSWKEVVVKIGKIMAEEDNFRESRRKINHIFNDNADGNSSERVFDRIMAKYYG